MKIPSTIVERANAPMATRRMLEATALIRIAFRHPIRWTTFPRTGDTADAVRKKRAVNTPSPVIEKPRSRPDLQEAGSE